MAAFEIIRFQVRPDALPAAEAALHEFAGYVHRELPGSWWTVYREAGAGASFVALLRTADAAATDHHHGAAGTQRLNSILTPLLLAPPTSTACALVTSSDLGRRPPRRR